MRSRQARPPGLRARQAGLVAIAACLLLAGCSVGSSEAGARDGDQRLTVLAAASLTETFGRLAKIYEADHPRVDVRLAFDSSATLAGQVVAGAPADVLATADARTMRTATDAGVTAARPQVFATNTMLLVVPADNPARITAVDDLEGATYVTCVESAPCGAAARALLEHNHVATEPSSLEVDVKAVLNKVALDEADAGLVYATDAVTAGDAVRTVPVPGAAAEPNSYLVAPLRQSEHPALATDWVDLLLSDRGRAVLDQAGFGAP